MRSRGSRIRAARDHVRERPSRESASKPDDPAHADTPLQRLINANGAAPEGLHASFVAKVNGDWQEVAHPPITRESCWGELTARCLPRGGKGLLQQASRSGSGLSTPCPARRVLDGCESCRSAGGGASPSARPQCPSQELRLWSRTHCGTRVARPRSGRSRRISETRWSVPPLIAVAAAAAVVVLGDLWTGLLVWWVLLCCLGDVCSVATLCAFKTVRLLPDRCLHTTLKTCAGDLEN